MDDETRQQYLDDMTAFWEWLIAQPDVSADLYGRIRAECPNIIDYNIGM